MSIGEKTVSGFLWTFSQQFISLFINFLVSVLLARVMLPSQFGLIGMIAVFVSVGEALMSGGLANSLIRTENPDELDYSTVFFANLVMSVLIYGAVFFSAPLIARFFHNQILIPVVRVYMLCILFYALSSVPCVKLMKEMDFKRLMIYHVPSLAVSGVVGVVLAYKGFGVWSLVWMTQTQAFCYFLQFWIRSRWIPVMAFDRQRLKRHFAFGSRLLASTVLDRVYANIYNLVIGRFYSVTELGYYTRSYSLAQIPSTNLSEALNKVSLPALSTLQNEQERLVLAYKRIMHQALFIIIPVLAMMVLTAQPLFRLLLTDKWLPAVPYFRVLCLAGVLGTVNVYNLTLLLVMGKSDTYLKLNIIEKVLITTGILLVVPLGIYGLLYFQVAASILIYLVNGRAYGRLIDYSVVRQIRDIAPLFLIAIATGLATYGLDRWLIGAILPGMNPGIRDFFHIALVCAFYLTVYASLFIAFKMPEMRDFNEMFLKRVTGKFFYRMSKADAI